MMENMWTAKISSWVSILLPCMVEEIYGRREWIIVLLVNKAWLNCTIFHCGFCSTGVEEVLNVSCLSGVQKFIPGYALLLLLFSDHWRSKLNIHLRTIM
eukprot:Gb_03674 [translate_table: standard]